MASILKVDQINDRTNNNKAIEIDSSGNVIAPNYVKSTPVGFSVFKDNGNVTGNSQLIIFNKAHTNLGNIYNTTTGVWTVSVSGYYFVSLYGMAASASNRILWLQLHKNDVAIDHFYPYADLATGQHPAQNGTAIFYFDSGDEIKARTGASSSVGMHGGGNAHNGFTAYLL